MKSAHLLHCLLMPAAAVLLCDCTTAPKTAPATTAATKSSTATDSLDDYEVVEASDPLEGLNRATFRLNDGIYKFLLRPISKGYETVTPKPVRQGLDNVFENIKFPVRFVNSGLQGKFGRAGKEVQKFGVNTVGGFGGIIKQSDKIPSLANVPREDTGQTLGVWGIGHGPYIVLPVFGASSVRETVGLAGDYAPNPVNWGFAVEGDLENYTWIPPAVNTLRQLPDQLQKYDDARADAVDPYLSVRSAYYQNRKAAVEE